MSQAYLRQPDLKLRVQRSGIHGYGLFAQMSFEKNDVIVEYIGKSHVPRMYIYVYVCMHLLHINSESSASLFRSEDSTGGGGQEGGHVRAGGRRLLLPIQVGAFLRTHIHLFNACRSVKYVCMYVCV